MFLKEAIGNLGNAFAPITQSGDTQHEMIYDTGLKQAHATRRPGENSSNGAIQHHRHGRMRGKRIRFNEQVSSETEQQNRCNPDDDDDDCGFPQQRFLAKLLKWIFCFLPHRC